MPRDSTEHENSSPPLVRPNTMTMAKIAAELKLSRATVYRVIYGKPNVKTQTRKKIEALLEQYSYHPNLAARSLKTNRAHAVALMLDNLSISVKHSMARAVVDECNARSSRTILQFFDDDNGDAFAGNLSQDIMGRRVDGLIADIDPLSCENVAFSQLLDNLHAERFPLVFLSLISDSPFCFVSTDRTKGTQRAIEHLIELGHRRIAFVTNGFQSHSVNLHYRLVGYRNALREAGMGSEDELVVPANGRELRDGYEAGIEVASLDNGPTAVFAVNDTLAIGMMKAFREKGMSIPDDIAMVGFDNIDAAEYAPVPLTSVGQPITQIASEGVRMLFDRIADRSLAAQQILLEPELVIRESCGARSALHRS